LRFVQNYSATAPGQCNLFARCAPSPYSGSHGADWCMEIEDCQRVAPRQPEPETKFKLFGEVNSEPFFAESNDGLTFSAERCGNSFLQPFFSSKSGLNRSLYQDRLGTHTAKVKI
jgi:hypothetical protein